MEQPGRCDHCGGEIYSQGDDQWWTCAECGCTWTLQGELIRRGPECVAVTGASEIVGPADEYLTD